jgi:hypothetical protein
MMVRHRGEAQYAQQEGGMPRLPTSGAHMPVESVSTLTTSTPWFRSAFERAGIMERQSPHCGLKKARTVGWALRNLEAQDPSSSYAAWLLLGASDDLAVICAFPIPTAATRLGQSQWLLVQPPTSPGYVNIMDGREWGAHAAQRPAQIWSFSGPVWSGLLFFLFFYLVFYLLGFLPRYIAIWTRCCCRRRINKYRASLRPQIAAHCFYLRSIHHIRTTRRLCCLVTRPSLRPLRVV